MIVSRLYCLGKRLNDLRGDRSIFGVVDNQSCGQYEGEQSQDETRNKIRGGSGLFNGMAPVLRGIDRHHRDRSIKSARIDRSSRCRRGAIDGGQALSGRAAVALSTAIACGVDRVDLTAVV